MKQSNGARSITKTERFPEQKDGIIPGLDFFLLLYRLLLSFDKAITFDSYSFRETSTNS